MSITTHGFSIPKAERTGKPDFKEAELSGVRNVLEIQWHIAVIRLHLGELFKCSRSNY